LGLRGKMETSTGSAASPGPGLPFRRNPAHNPEARRPLKSIDIKATRQSRLNRTRIDDPVRKKLSIPTLPPDRPAGG